MALARSARALAPPPGAWHDAYLAPAYAVFGRALAAGSGLLGREDVQAGGHAPQPPHTIFALSTGPGRAAVAVVRLSGPGADAALAALLPRQRALPPPRTLALATLRHPETREVLDKAMVVRFPAPGSFTGEDAAELHVHGGPAVVRCVLDALQALHWARPAEAGEFSRRAFEAGKLDLTEVEGLADLLRAETEAQRRQALQHSGGAVRRQYEAWRATLLTCLARVEAVIDFGEDEGIADEVAAGVVPLARQLREELERHLAAASTGELVREGVRVAIVGPPNAGKSSLLNALAGREAAIVSPLPGTTRDIVEVALDLGGYRVVVTDSAGVRETECPIEAEGVRRAWRTAEAAHIVLLLQDASLAAEGAADNAVEAAAAAAAEPGLAAWAAEQRQRQGSHESSHAAQALVLPVFNKLDKLPLGAWEQLSGGPSPAVNNSPGSGAGQPAATLAAGQRAVHNPHTDEQGALGISCTTGAGLEELLRQLQQAVQRVVAGGGDPAGTALVARARHRRHVSEAVAALRRYEVATMQVEVAAEELRGAARALGRVTGAIDTEAVLDSVFTEFCIGK